MRFHGCFIHSIVCAAHGKIVKNVLQSPGEVTWRANFGVKLARLRPGSRAAYVIASVTASRRLQFASRGFATPRRRPPRRFDFGTRDGAVQLTPGRSMKAIVKGGSPLC